jgi:hypothetical protein
VVDLRAMRFVSSLILVASLSGCLIPTERSLAQLNNPQIWVYVEAIDEGHMRVSVQLSSDDSCWSFPKRLAATLNDAPLPLQNPTGPFACSSPYYSGEFPSAEGDTVIVIAQQGIKLTATFPGLLATPRLQWVSPADGVVARGEMAELTSPDGNELGGFNAATFSPEDVEFLPGGMRFRVPLSAPPGVTSLLASLWRNQQASTCDGFDPCPSAYWNGTGQATIDVR